jgi:hypothetical protein
MSGGIYLIQIKNIPNFFNKSGNCGLQFSQIKKLTQPEVPVAA